MGLVDLHCHLLWAVDDGCRDAAEALAAARALAGAGYTDAVPTPHARGDFPGADPGTCEARLGELRALLAAEGIALALHRGSENFLDEGFFAGIDRGEPRVLGAGRYTLVELPFAAAVPALPDLVFRVKLKGLTPVIAHPERCAELGRPGRAAEAVRLGAALQLDVGALVGRYGREARRTAERLLDESLYAVAATDVHRPDDAARWIPEALAALARRAGEEALSRLCEANPRRVLSGEELA